MRRSPSVAERGAGPAPVHLAIAGFGVTFKGPAPGILGVLRRRYAPFAAARRGRFALEVLERAGRPAPFKPSVSRVWPRLELGRGDFHAALDLRAGTGSLAAGANEQCLDAFLRSLLSCLLLRSGGAMLHSACVVKDGRAHLFLGRSGAGKSTLSRLAAGAGYEVISDEINLLRPAGGRFMAHGSPFWGEMRCDGRPGVRSLGGVYLLKKSGRNALKPCGGGEAVKLLLRCLLNFERGQEAAGLALDTAAGLLAKVQCRYLRFSKKDASFMDLI